MKKLISLLLLSIFCFSLAGCGQAGRGANEPDAERAGGDTTADGQTALTIVTTIFPPYDFARQIGGQRVEVTQLLPPGTESHSFEPSPQDIIRIQKADLFIYVGGESDAWVEKILTSLDTSSLRTLTLMDCVEKLEEEIPEGLEGEGFVGHRHSDDADADADAGAGASAGAGAGFVPGGSSHADEVEFDEHPWTSPRNAILIAEKIAGALSGLDPDHAGEYEANLAAYREELTALDQEFQAAVESGKRDVILFGDRFPFRYFTEAYGLRYYAAFPGCSAESEASAATIAFLIDKIRGEGIPAVFYLEFSNEKIADILCEDTGAVKLRFHSCHNLSKEDFQNGVTYLDLMRQNLTTLKEALS